MSKKPDAATALVDILRREQVEVIFGVPGGPLLPIYDRLATDTKINLILTKHEQAAAYAAYTYARRTGRLGVCSATLGPGATNLVSGLPLALLGNAPVLALTGQVQTTAFGRGAHQESTGWFRTPDQQAMFAATTKHSATCVEATRLPDMVRHCIRIAYSGRPGPAHLIIPSNILHTEIDYQGLEPHRYRLIDHRPVDRAALREIAKTLDAARRPVVLLGDRAAGKGCGEYLEQFALRHHVALAADLSSKSAVDERHPNYLGCLGVMGHRMAERYVRERCDVLVAVGQTFDEISTLSWDPAIIAGKKLIQIDVDEEEIGKVYPVTQAVVGDLRTTIGELDALLDPASSSRRQVEITALHRNLAEQPIFDAPEMSDRRTPLLPQRVVAELRDGLPDDAVVLSDSSKWARWLGRYFQSGRDGVECAHDYEPMGWAVAGAIGAKLAHPDRVVVCVSGDGAFLMSALELSTAVNHGLAIIWVVMNDARLGIIYDLQVALYGGRPVSTTFEPPDLAKFAEAMGMHGALIESPDELASALKEAVASKRPALLDVRFDADEVPAVRPRSLLITREMGLPDPKPSIETTRALIKLLKDK